MMQLHLAVYKELLGNHADAAMKIMEQGEAITAKKSAGASKLLPNLVQADIIEPVSGHEKGKSYVMS